MSTVPAVTFRSYQQLQFVPISILDDQIVEGDEFFTAALLTPPTFRGVKLTSDPANISILDNDCELTIYYDNGCVVILISCIERRDHVTMCYGHVTIM